MDFFRKYKIIIGLVIVGAAAIIAGAWLWWRLSDARLRRPLASFPQFIALYEKARSAEREFKAEPDKTGPYFNAALYWKSLGEQVTSTDSRPYFERSLKVYEQGIARFGDTNILIYLNGGKVAERLGDYAKAEQYFKKAIAISSADESGYLALSELYIYRLPQPKEVIVKLLTDGLPKMLNPSPLISARATYLRRVGDYQAALSDYRILSQNFPNHYGFRQIISELETLLAAGK